jgi:GAF domain-containing protein
MATAIQNTRLLEQVQRSARRERLIHEISSKVRQSPDIETVLETTAREVGRALNVSRTTVRLGTPLDEEDEAEGADQVDGGAAEAVIQ